MRKSRFAAQLLRSTIMTGALVAMAAPALAQDDDDDDRIVVTGTRILNPNLTASSPITSVDAEEFDLSGATRVEDLLNVYPQLSPSFDFFTVNPTTGFSTADLRGLGTNRTLILVNGHRLQPGGLRAQARDLNQIPAALVKRVDVLTGGASAVYGSDAMAGVINFILDNDFEGFSLSSGISGYWHNNNNDYILGNAAGTGGCRILCRGFDSPSGDSGIQGKAYNVDVALGSQFADGAGHAMAYFTYRKNDELRQAARDYSSCALSANGRTCGGSSTAPLPNFFFVDDGLIGFAHQDQTTGMWLPGVGELYNYAPVNHYQRPDERWTFGGALSYEVAPHFRPYIETMFANTNTSVQIAETGTFFVNTFFYDCANPGTDGDVDALLGTACGDLGLSGFGGGDGFLYIGKRNVEGGPRIANLESNSFRAVTGAEGEIGGGWSYNASFLYGRNQTSESNVNDFLVDQVEGAVLACSVGGAIDPAAPGCYNVFTPGGVTPAAAAGLSGAGLRDASTAIMVVNGYVSGDTGIVSPWATDAIALVTGVEWRKEFYQRIVDNNMATGNFTGLGGPRLPIDGSYSVTEWFAEAGVPIIQDMGYLQSLALDLGYRYSNYNTSGGVHTYKAGATAQIGDYVRLRGGYNRAIRSGNVDEFFAETQLALFGGNDPCAVAVLGDVPEFTLAQCQNTGMSAAQFGTTLKSPAAQYNQIIGGNPNVNPEIADTWTVGAIVTPAGTVLEGLQIGADYYDITIKDTIATIGAQTILEGCANTGSVFLCSLVNRNPATGDLWLGSDPATSGNVVNSLANFGNLHWRGVDITGSYSHDLFAGRISASFVGSYYIEQQVDPLPGISPGSIYDCAGVINIACQQPSWRHTLRVSYSQNWITGSVRWRRIGSMGYINQNGTPGTTDDILEIDNGGQLPAWNYVDLTMSLDVHENASVVFGVNNILDKEPPIVGSTLALNANSPGGYDQLGRYLHAALNLRF